VAGKDWACNENPGRTTVHVALWRRKRESGVTKKRQPERQQTAREASGELAVWTATKGLGA